MWDVAIIGAGLTGLTCARKLQSAGYRVCLVDKSQRVGGRMATRRVRLAEAQKRPGRLGQSAATSRASREANLPRLDHGLRYWHPTTAPLKALTEELLTAKVIQPWSVQAYELRENSALVAVDSPDPIYAAPEGMRVIAEHLATPFNLDETLFTGRCITRLSYLSPGWQLSTEDGFSLKARRCVLTLPAPQAAALIASTLDSAAFLAEMQTTLDAVSYHSCLTVLAGYTAPFSLTGLNSDGWMVTDTIGTSTQWIGLDSSKRTAAKSPTIVIHSKPGFARRYLDSQDLQPAAAVLLRANARKYGDPLVQPDWFQIHRWRYAIVEKSCSEACLAAGEGLFAGGDWCVPASGGAEEGLIQTWEYQISPIDRAHQSGLALAEALQS